MPTTTSRLGLQGPVGTDSVSEYRTAITANAGILDTAVLESSGTASAMPAAGTIGRFYFQTDTGTLLYDNGTAWMTIHASTFTTLTYAINNATQTFNSGTTTTVALNGIVRDDGGNFNTTTHLYTVPQSGQYQVFGQIGFSSNVANSQLLVFHNAAQVVQGDSPSSGSAFIVAGPTSATAGDTLSLQFTNGSNASQTSVANFALMQVNRISVH